VRRIQATKKDEKERERTIPSTGIWSRRKKNVQEKYHLHRIPTTGSIGSTFVHTQLVEGFNQKVHQVVHEEQFELFNLTEIPSIGQIC
jgi:hypothetical protein